MIGIEVLHENVIRKSNHYDYCSKLNQMCFFFLNAKPVACDLLFYCIGNIHSCAFKRRWQLAKKLFSSLNI